jgi:hypothetical protein
VNLPVAFHEGMSMLIELLVDAFFIAFMIIAAYGHVLLLKALLPDTWWRRKPATGGRRQRAVAQA